ncbi:MAG TPA: 16S rRNA (guanine(527)-N(7))-methyltransferase RsmG [Candidatus Udaeobacter sp.]|nr:16S rRNA (guanine(527)-N(7))-methyltransferase RsmG [Candidatus Udaeobacter sp.]
MSDSRLAELARLIDEWPGLVSGPSGELVQDCLVLAGHLGGAHTLVDVGSGGGLPGLVLKIVRPDLAVTLVEADQGKAAFLVQASARLALAAVEVVARRAEEAARDPQYREKFDLATARALAAMPVLAELCLPFVRVGGRLLAQKTDREDVAAAAPAIELLGGSAPQIVAAPSPARSAGTIVIVTKLKPTPKAYPRRPGVPARRPL